ncbi:MAG TPA: DUF502 domain-containing protein [Burkholderiaceae bacterium]|nr:DUF502 domain-containing protein [Burkholderiaceae bacterium]
MLRSINRNILVGLITILPVALTLYLLYWLTVSTESVLGDVVRAALPDEWYRPGMGVAAGLISAFVVGLLMRTVVAQRLFAWGERILFRLPLVRSVYQSLRDLLDYFSPARKKEFEQVVAVTLGETGMQVIGLVTQTGPDRLPEDFGGQDSVLVYFPMSYGIGGYAVLMPRSAVRPLSMSLEDAMRFVLTAGVTGTAKQATAAGAPSAP